MCAIARRGTLKAPLSTSLPRRKPHFLSRLPLFGLLAGMMAVCFAPSASAGYAKYPVLVTQGAFAPHVVSYCIRNGGEKYLLQGEGSMGARNSMYTYRLRPYYPAEPSRLTNNGDSVAFVDVEMTRTYLIASGKGITEGVRFPFIFYSNNVLRATVQAVESSFMTAPYLSYSEYGAKMRYIITSGDQIIASTDFIAWTQLENAISLRRMMGEVQADPMTAKAYIQERILVRVELFWASAYLRTQPLIGPDIQIDYRSEWVEYGTGFEPFGDEIKYYSPNQDVVDAINPPGVTIQTRPDIPASTIPPVDATMPQSPVDELDLQPFWTSFLSSSFGQLILAVAAIAVSMGLIGYLARRRTK